MQRRDRAPAAIGDEDGDTVGRAHSGDGNGRGVSREADRTVGGGWKTDHGRRVHDDSAMHLPQQHRLRVTETRRLEKRRRAGPPIMAFASLRSEVEVRPPGSDAGAEGVGDPWNPLDRGTAHQPDTVDLVEAP
jgi:hypothetical protein